MSTSFKEVFDPKEVIDCKMMPYLERRTNRYFKRHIRVLLDLVGGTLDLVVKYLIHNERLYFGQWGLDMRFAALNFVVGLTYC